MCLRINLFLMLIKSNKVFNIWNEGGTVKLKSELIDRGNVCMLADDVSNHTDDI